MGRKSAQPENIDTKVIPNNWMFYIIARRRIATVKGAAWFQQGYGWRRKLTISIICWADLKMTLIPA